MKSFIYKTTFKNATYGQKVINAVYKVINNKPIYLGETTYNTGSFKGHENEAVRCLVELKALPKKSITSFGYINEDEIGKSFNIYTL